MVFRRVGTYAIMAILMVLVVAVTLFVYPAWSQDGKRNTEKKVEKKVEKKKAQKKNGADSRNRDRRPRNPDRNNDGIISQDEQLEDAESLLDEETTNGEVTNGEVTNGEVTNGEVTNGEVTNGDDFDDAGPAVSASVDDGEAEASTPGAVARSGGDPDEQAPVGQQQAEEQGGDVVDEIPTEGPLPETGGASFLALVLPAVGFLLLSAAIVHRFRQRR